MELSLKERDRVSVLRQVSEGVLTASAGARRIGVTPRHFRRLLRRFEAEGDAVAVHGLRGRASNRALPPEVRQAVLALAEDPMFRDFGPTLLAEHVELACGLRVSRETVRRWLLESGLRTRSRKRAKHRSRRPRRAALGELAQWDSSVHRWLEDRVEGDLTLIALHDDATSRLMAARFVARDNGAENRRVIIDYLRRHGRPLAVYTDHAGHFGQWQSEKEKRTDTIISKALGELDIGLILASSPQAKGRVERTFGTAQDRLIKEMRLARISDLEKANEFLEEYWAPLWNERFATAPAEARDAHRPLPAGVDLDALFAETVVRKVARDFTIRFKNELWQIPEHEATDLAPGAEIVVERRLDGELRFRSGSRYLDVESLGCARSRPKAPAQPAEEKTPKPLGKPPKPGSGHPWRLRIQAEVQRALARRKRREERGRSDE